MILERRCSHCHTQTLFKSKYNVGDCVTISGPGGGLKGQQVLKVKFDEDSQRFVYVFDLCGEDVEVREYELYR